MEANNVWMGIGNLGADPELRKTASGDAVCNFRIAVDRTYRSNGRQVEATTWIPVVTWRGQAEHLYKWLQKGSQVSVVGRLEIRQYTDKDGVSRTSAEIVADTVKFLAGTRSKTDVEAAENSAQASA